VLLLLLLQDIEDAIAAQKRCHGQVFDGRTITVEFVESSRLGRQDRWVRRGSWRTCLCAHKFT
jgi:hypothetical protein